MALSKKMRELLKEYGGGGVSTEHAMVCKINALEKRTIQLESEIKQLRDSQGGH